MNRPLAPALLTLALLEAVVATARAAEPAAAPASDRHPDAIRVATYNVAMYRDQAGDLFRELEQGDSRQAKRIAEVIQRVRPDILLINEFDYEEGKQARLPEVFRERYLAKSQAGLDPIDFPHQFYEPVNTGVDSGLDLDGDGRTGGPADAWGYGRYPGQYGMLVLSRWPINRWRTYQEMKWRHLEDSTWPKAPQTGEHFYPKSVRDKMRLASKSLWDVEIKLPTKDPGRKWHPLRILCSHPTPPVFDGPEDRNGCRNYDEIRMIATYISGSRRSRFPVDWNETLSEGEGYETLPKDYDFVVLGDLNADPIDGSGRPGAISQLLDHPAIDSAFVPTSEGAIDSSQARPDLNANHQGDPAHDTADFSGDGASNLRVDYVLPSKDLKVVGGGVFWPKEGEPGAEAVRASDHRLVWLDVIPQ